MKHALSYFAFLCNERLLDFSGWDDINVNVCSVRDYYLSLMTKKYCLK